MRNPRSTENEKSRTQGDRIQKKPAETRRRESEKCHFNFSGILRRGLTAGKMGIERRIREAREKQRAADRMCEGARETLSSALYPEVVRQFAQTPQNELSSIRRERLNPPIRVRTAGSPSPRGFISVLYLYIYRSSPSPPPHPPHFNNPTATPLSRFFANSSSILRPRPRENRVTDTYIQ